MISNSYCHIHINTLLAAPYNVDGGDSIYAKVVAVNVYGETTQSTEGNGAYYTRVPDQPINLAEDISVRSSTTDGLTWADGINNGGVPIIDYRVNMREQGGTYTVIATGITTQSHTATGLTLGVTYEFAVEARNSVGYSSPSNSVTILHALMPEAPNTPTTTNVGTTVVVDWDEPVNNGAAISSYTILI